MSSLLRKYKSFVRQHPSLVANAERLLHWFAWNPERFSGSEYAYEGFNAAVGLLGVYNDAILSERPGQEQLARWALWLAAVEQVQTLVELRAIHLEQRGKMSRYGPLIFLELLKTALRLALWRASGCKLALAEVNQEDEEQQESEVQLKELLQALTRLRQQHNFDPVTAATPEHLQYNAHLAHASAVRAAAVAPSRPPAACAVGAAAGPGAVVLPRAGNLADKDQGPAAAAAAMSPGETGRQQQQQGQPPASVGSSAGSGSNAAKHLRCAVCGAVQAVAIATCISSSSGGVGGSGTDYTQQPQQQQLCKVCGRPLQDSSSSSGCGRASKHLPGISEIVPDEQQSTAAHDTTSTSSSLAKGWWQHLTGGSSSSGRGEPPSQQEQGQQPAGSTAASSLAGSLPGSWGPALRPCSIGPDVAAGSSQADLAWWQQHQPPRWCLSHRDASIGCSVVQAGELVHVLRPLVYVVLLKRFGLTSWKPWLASLVLDLASGYGLYTGHAILERSNASRWPAGSTLYSLALLRGLSSARWSPGEQQELLARRLMLLRYLLRSPCYTVFTRRLLLKLVAGSRYVPGLANLADFAFSMVEGMQSYYTYVES